MRGLAWCGFPDAVVATNFVKLFSAWLIARNLVIRKDEELFFKIVASIAPRPPHWICHGKGLLLAYRKSDFRTCTDLNE